MSGILRKFMRVLSVMLAGIIIMTSMVAARAYTVNAEEPDSNPVITIPDDPLDDPDDDNDDDDDDDNDDADKQTPDDKKNPEDVKTPEDDDDEEEDPDQIIEGMTLRSAPALRNAPDSVVVTLNVDFVGVAYGDEESADEVLANASPVLRRLTDSGTNTYDTISDGGSFTVIPGEAVGLYIRVNSGYEFTMDGSGMELSGFFTGQWNINYGQEENTGSGSWSMVNTDGNWSESSTLNLELRIQKKDDPGEDPIDYGEPGIATFTASYKNNSNAHVSIEYYIADDDDSSGTVPAAGVSGIASVKGFKVILEDGYVLSDDAMLVITQTAGDNMGSNDYNGLLKNFEAATGAFGYFFEGCQAGEAPKEYTCTISNVAVREAESSDLVGQYKLVLVANDGLSLNGRMDAGAYRNGSFSEENEITSSYTHFDAGSGSGQSGYTRLSNEATGLFVTLNSDTDRDNFEQATLVGYDASGNVVSSINFDYETMKRERMGTGAVNPAYSYILTVTLSRQKKIYWTSSDTANCSLYLLTAQGNENPDSTSRREGSSFSADIGTTYYFLMMPSYGYQVSSLDVNGNSITPIAGDANMGIFKFVMGNGDFRIQPSLARNNDVVTNTSNTVNGASISNGSAAGVGGNLSMNVTDAAVDNTAIEASSAYGSGEVSAVATVDIDLKQIVSQGNGTNWNKDLTELSGAITVGLGVPNDLSAGETYSVIREHEGVKTELAASYNASTQVLSFPSNQFSSFTIIKRPKPAASASESSGGSSSSSGSSSDTASSVPAATASTTGALGIVSGGGTIESWSELDAVILKESSTANTSGDSADKEPELVQVTIDNSKAQIPETTFKALENSDKAGLHLFLGEDMAITFENTGKLAGQKTVDLYHETVDAPNLKTITFRTYSKLAAKTTLHSKVPAGTKTVRVYYYDAKGRRKLLGKVTPTTEGRFCIGITILTKYEFVY